MPSRIDITGALRKMKALANVLQRPLRDVLDTAARVTATEMTRRAAPFGTGEDAKSAGEKAVARDIARVYGTAGGAFEAIGDRRLRGAFWTHYKNGEYDKAADIGQDAGVNVGHFDLGTLHRRARDSRGHVRQTKPSLYIIDPYHRKNLEAYIKNEQGHVGTVKGGFADIIRSTGGRIRGLREPGDITANWITRKGRGYGQSFKGGSDNSPTLRIRNRITYADQALSSYHKSAAIEAGYRRAITALQYAVKNEVKNLKYAA